MREMYADTYTYTSRKHTRSQRQSHQKLDKIDCQKKKTLSIVPQDIRTDERVTESKRRSSLIRALRLETSNIFRFKYIQNLMGPTVIAAQIRAGWKVKISNLPQKGTPDPKHNMDFWKNVVKTYGLLGFLALKLSVQMFII